MYGSPSATATKDQNHPFPAETPAFRQRKEESDLDRQQQMSYGLLRYSSAPSSFFGELCEGFFPVRPSSLDTESIFSLLDPDPRDETRYRANTIERTSQFTSSVPPAVDQSGGFSHGSHSYYHSQQQHHLLAVAPESSLATETDQMKSGSAAAGGNLIRQSSSPAGLFSHLDVDSGYGTGASVGMEVASRRMGSCASGGSNNPEDSSNGRCFVPGYPVTSWDDSSLLPENFSPCCSTGGHKWAREIGAAAGVNTTESQNREIRNHHVSGLTHHFSLPKTSSEMEALQKFFQFQGSVPFKIRAKRGCATHPRSIAERVRRTRISERMRKLQELVPNMDKQTNTADMLDLAVDYIKDLQKEVKSLSESRSTCVCSVSKQMHYKNQAS